MPNFTYNYTNQSDWESNAYTIVTEVPSQYSSFDPIQQLWEELQQMIDQQEKQAEELRKDKVNYPLFFLKEGIV